MVLLVFSIVDYSQITKVPFKSKQSKLLVNGYLYLLTLVILLFFIFY
jgi:hypothetical protein